MALLSPSRSPASLRILYAVRGSAHPPLQAVIRGMANSLFLFDLLITRHLLTSLEDVQWLVAFKCIATQACKTDILVFQIGHL